MATDPPFVLLWNTRRPETEHAADTGDQQVRRCRSMRVGPLTGLIRHDTVIGWLSQSFGARRAARITGGCILPCTSNPRRSHPPSRISVAASSSPRSDASWDVRAAIGRR
jgi:hypothetical protein